MKIRALLPSSVQLQFRSPCNVCWGVVNLWNACHVTLMPQAITSRVVVGCKSVCNTNCGSRQALGCQLVGVKGRPCIALLLNDVTL
jgi:hypothetical protein